MPAREETTKIFKDTCVIRYYPKFKRYEVDAGLKLGGTKRYRKQFKNKRDALIHAQELKERLDLEGQNGFRLSREQQIDAEVALGLLNGRTSLKIACEYYMKFHGNERSDLTVAELVREFMDHRDKMAVFDSRGSSERTYKDYYYRLGLLKGAFGNKEVVSFNEEDFIAWLRRRGGARGMIRTTKALFSYAVERNYLPENPIRSQVPKAKVGKPRIMDDQCWRELVLTALKTQDHVNSPKGQRIDLLAYVVLGLWCGLRPEAELMRLDWSDVNVEDGFVNIHDDWKVAIGRHVTIPDCAKGFLRQCIRQTGPVVNPRNFRGRWDWLRKTAGVYDTWSSDVMRHTYASMHYAFYGDKGLIINELGHCNSSMLRHYVNHGVKIRKRSVEFFSFTSTYVKFVDAV